MYQSNILRLRGVAPRLQAHPTNTPHHHIPHLLPLSTQRAYSLPAESPPPQFTPSNRLSNRTCMITGGTSGIGFSIAERFLQEGASRVILVGRSYERLYNAASRLQIDSPAIIPSTEPPQPITNPEKHQLLDSSSRISLLIGDIADAGSWTRELEKAMQATNPDILVNAAGLSISSILPKSEPTDISRILRTNLEGALLTSRAFIRASIRNRMKKSTTTTSESPAASSSSSSSSSKCIINISSLLAHKSGTGAVPYAASKAGVLGLTRSVAVEAAASLRDVVVRSNAIVPGYIETPMISDFSDGETARLKESIPVRRFGRPEEVADAAVFLAQNEYANNCVLNLDGGLSAI
ncbi:3-oxoacyl-acyl carrier protein reductase [Aspergillus eucalypticola CBS 122712]|uniref:3-oxoacyl-acyl carrier protein reductase n=1 Tax=Aspergillus eucalypticola (strain CBS 122712 / IBT 29274) TaxID=1448314 RepID=A0A317USW4_ASPEC|nr:3-oxoacyl-acyl carrier protein reductase [Aspergillus eucalypticola CBS 122712]PWY64218.1 3-oxoacyl-acyl carrier protein reductase [Aspergillus eucalypticola CBS 122712]